MAPESWQRQFAIALLAAALLAPHCYASGDNDAQAGFHKLQTLEGDWLGKDEHGHAVRSYFSAIAANTAVMESVRSGGQEMVSVYSLDADSILLVHYCPSNHQPRLRAEPAPGPIRRLVFSFLKAINLPNPAAAHKYRLVIEFEDRDHITETWTWRGEQKDSEMVFHLARLHLSRN